MLHGIENEKYNCDATTNNKKTTKDIRLVNTWTYLSFPFYSFSLLGEWMWRDHGGEESRMEVIKSS